MADTTPESSSSEKTGRSRSKKKKGQGAGITETATLNQQHMLSPEILKSQIEEAKEAKDFKLAQKLREQLWTLRDTIALDSDFPSRPASTPHLPLNSSNEVNVSEMLKEPEVVPDSSENPTAKSLHKLEKKMKAIQELKAKRSKGIKLEANQRAKIGTEDELQKEIDMLKKMLSDN